MNAKLLWLILGSICFLSSESGSFDEPLELDCQSIDSFNMDKRGPPPPKQLWRSHWKKQGGKQSSSSPIQSCKPLPAHKLLIAEAPPPEVALPSGRPCPVRSWGGVGIKAALLIWQSKMWGFEFAGKSMNPESTPPSSASVEEKIFVPDFAWRPGFKLDLSYDCGFDGWDLDGRWTFYQGEDTMLKKYFDVLTSPAGLGVIPLWFYPFYTVAEPSEIRFRQGKMNWRHYFHSIDLELGRISSFSRRTAVHLFAGLKGAWMRQTYRVSYADGPEITAIIPGTIGSTLFSLMESAISFKNKTWGGGPRVGIDSRWKLAWGLSLIGNGAFSLLYSAIQTHRDQNDLNRNSSTGSPLFFHMHLKTESHQLKPVAEVQLGLDWAACIDQKSIINLSIAYEVQYWWGQNELRRNYSHTEPGGTFPMRGDLQMHGLTAAIGYHY